MSRSLETLDRLVSFNTVSSRSNLELIGYIEDFLVVRGFRVQRIEDPNEPKAGLLAEIGPAIEGGLLLSAHSDVVPVAGQNWTKDPFKLTQEGDRLFGRGTTDMKGFLAEMLALADVVSGQELKAPLKLLISYDEEIGCVGITRMRERLRPLLGRPKLAIVGEPTEMQVAIGHKGKRSYRAEIQGEAGHSALAPHFVNALHVAVDFVSKIRDLQDDFQKSGARNDHFDIPYTTLHVGTLSGGTALNIVPDKAELLFEFRHLAEDDPEKVASRLQEAATTVVNKHGPAAKIQFKPLAGYPGLAVAETDQVVSQVQSWGGGAVSHVAFGTEAGVLSELGVRTVVCGPGSMAGQGHKPDEFISKQQLAACSELLRNAVKEMVFDAPET